MYLLVKSEYRSLKSKKGACIGAAVVGCLTYYGLSASVGGQSLLLVGKEVQRDVLKKEPLTKPELHVRTAVTHGKFNIGMNYQGSEKLP
nr:MAG TPA: hypothetical protein [Caudoviricetes sp.]